MNTLRGSQRQWAKVYRTLGSQRGVRGVRIARGAIPHPRDAGGRLTTSWPVGQIADYAVPAPIGGSQMVVREFPDRWEACLDTAAMTARVAQAVERDPSNAMYIGAALLGGAIGSSVSGTRQGMMAGAGLGLLLAALLDDDRARSRYGRPGRRSTW
jgi:hypothetical protein